MALTGWLGYSVTDLFFEWRGYVRRRRNERVGKLKRVVPILQLGRQAGPLRAWHSYTQGRMQVNSSALGREVN